MRLIAPIEDYATKRHTPALRATPLDRDPCSWTGHCLELLGGRARPCARFRTFAFPRQSSPAEGPAGPPEYYQPR